MVHLGGERSTATGLRAGRLTLICPASVDQPFWSHRVEKLGCGPERQLMRHQQAGPLAEGLRELVTSKSYRTRAGAIADGITKEGGITRAIEVIAAARPPSLS